MGQSVNTNIASLSAQRQLNKTNASLNISMSRLISGQRINSAKDDAAGLAIAERMNAQIKGMNMATRNANDGISMIQTAEGAMGNITDSMHRMRELAVQAANGTSSDSDKANLDSEYQKLAEEIGRVIKDTSFNGTKLLNGNQATYANSATASDTNLSFQIGANNDGNHRIDVDIENLAATASKVTIAVGSHNTSGVTQVATTGYSSTDAVIDNAKETGTDILTQNGARAALTRLDDAINELTSGRGNLGSSQSRLDSIIDTLAVSIENTSASRGRIMDADFAQETANMTRAQILQQVGGAMLAQANQAPNSVLGLLNG